MTLTKMGPCTLPIVPGRRAPSLRHLRMSAVVCCSWRSNGDMGNGGKLQQAGELCGRTAHALGLLFISVKLPFEPKLASVTRQEPSSPGRARDACAVQKVICLKKRPGFRIA